MRPIDAIDLQRFPDMEPLIDHWRAHKRDALMDMQAGPLAAHADDLVVLEARKDGSFLYLHYGKNVGGKSGLQMQGKSTRDFDSAMGTVFEETYTKALAANVPYYSVNKSAASHLAHSWQRLVLPLPASKKRKKSHLIALVRQMVLVEDILGDFARDTGFLGGTMEPIIEGGKVRDFALLCLVDPRQVLGKDVATLSALCDRPLTLSQMQAILSAADGQTCLTLELPNSWERFGRGFVLSVSGGQQQPVFAISDATEILQARSHAEDRKKAMEDFANTASDWMWESDAEHRMTLLTSAVTKHTGFEAEHYIGKSRFRFADDPDNADAFEAHRAEIDARQPFRELTYKINAADGTERWLSVSGIPRFAEDGSFLGYRGTGTNITQEVETRRALEDQRQAMEDFANSASDWMWEVDADHRFTMMSTAIKSITGKDHESYLGTCRFDLMSAPQNAQVLAEHRATIKARKPFSNFVYQVLLNDGRVMWARGNGRPIFDKDGAFLGYRGTGSNITDEVEAREQAARRAQELSQAHRLGRLGAWSFNLRTKLVTLSPEFLALVDLPPERSVLSVEEALSYFAAPSRAVVNEAFAALLRRKPSDTLDVEWLLKGGQAMALNVTVKTRLDGQGRLRELFGTVQDITERKKTERALEALAFHDPLTGLGNRAYFSRDLDEVLERIERRGGFAGLLLLDLDHFKEVNDTLGHVAGDELLRRVSERLSVAVQSSGSVYRLGGDEFAVLLPAIDGAHDMEPVAQSILAVFGSKMKLIEGSVDISTSIGKVLMPTQSSNAEEAMRFADLALYEAKAEGRNRAVLFHDEFDHSVKDRVSLARDLRTAIADDQLDAHYQLQVDVMSGRVSGFEALVRWEHPTRGNIPPDRFIPIAESSRLIADLGAWMVEKVCRQGRAWLDAGGARLEMAVNLSVAQLWHRDVEADIRHALDVSGFPPDLLCVELTESVFSGDAMPRIQQLFASLKELGVKIALDDFGTGYSSLQYLNALSIDKLKIDRSFIINCDTDPEQLRLLQGIVGLGRGLGLSVIVEGVESEAELQVVCDLGCEYVQGFFFAKPKSFHEACLEAAKVEADYGLTPVLWKYQQDKDSARSADAARNKPAKVLKGRKRPFASSKRSA